MRRPGAHPRPASHCRAIAPIGLAAGPLLGWLGALLPGLRRCWAARQDGGAGDEDEASVHWASPAPAASPGARARALRPGFREGLAELRELGRTHTRAVLCAEAVWWRCHRRTPARFADYVRCFASSGRARHLHAQPLRRGLQQRHIALTPAPSS